MRGIWRTAFLTIAALAAGAAAPAAATTLAAASATATAAVRDPVVTPAIDLGPGPFAVVVAPNGKTAYVASGGVTPIRTATNTAGKAIKVGVGPTDIAITPDGKTVYVANDAKPETTGNTVTPIRTATNKAGKAITVGSDPGPLAITPDGKTVYVPNVGSDTVSAISTATNRVVKTMKVGPSPGDIAITPDGRTAYVGVASTHAIVVVRTATNFAGKAIKIGGVPTVIAITPDGKTAYAVSAIAGTVTPIRTATNTAGKAIKTGMFPGAIAIAPDGKIAYVVNSPNNGDPGTVTPIRTATNSKLKNITVGFNPKAIAITPDGKTAYVVNSFPGSVTPIRTATGIAGKALKVGGVPVAIAITPDGKTAYVFSAGSCMLTPIRTATNTVLKKIQLGCNPERSRPGRAAPADHPATPSGWGTAEQIPGLAAINQQSAEIGPISCPSPGNCAVGGSFTNGYNFMQAAFVISLRNGRWGQLVPLPGGAGPQTFNSDSSINSLSCATPGNCSGGGTYADIQGIFQAFVISEVGGRWGSPEQVRGTAVPTTDGSASIDSVVCPSAGNCTAVGRLSLGNGQDWIIVVSERGGRWGPAQKIIGPVTITSVGVFSCSSAGNCVIAGFYENKYNGRSHPFVVNERGGRWGAVYTLTGLVKLTAGQGFALNASSCPSAGNCTAVGQYNDAEHHAQAFIINERGGHWRAAFEMPGTAKLNSGGVAQANSVSCPSVGNCSAGGDYTDAKGIHQAFVVTERNGRWGKPIEVPGTAKLNQGQSAVVEAMSCPSAGNCAASGFFFTTSSNFEAYVVNERGGQWGTAIVVPGLAKLNLGGYALASAVTCPAVSYCLAGGYYSPFTGGGIGNTQAFVVTRTG